MIIETLTDNKNRTASEVRSILTKNGGNLGETGSVSFNFQQLGEISFDNKLKTKDDIINVAIENDAIDILEEERPLKILCKPNNFGSLKNLLEKKFVEPNSAKLIWNPLSFKHEEAKIFYIINCLEENDDVQNVYTNLEISDETIQKLNENL